MKYIGLLLIIISLLGASEGLSKDNIIGITLGLLLVGMGVYFAK